MLSFYAWFVVICCTPSPTVCVIFPNTLALFDIDMCLNYIRYRGGAVFVEGAESVVIERNLFKRVDGNAVLLSGYTRDVVIDSNEFTCV